ncbi:MAG TPA: transglycosylase domain-containing protein [Rugosimonospora sp.]|nr:transglycosylase domain-containing protein [Rugosimonospora sp.]
MASGAVVAAAVAPGTLLTGLVAKQASDAYLSLPSDLIIPPTAQVSYVYASDGKTLITTFYDQNRRNVPLTDVATVVQQAVVAAEDTRFYQHGGVDLRSMLRAIVSDSRQGQAAQGASTLTMQYVRNVLKYDPHLSAAQRADATVDTPARKLREVRYAVALEKKLSKQQILEGYLNIAYFGDGAYGVYAASETYFGKSPGELTLPEAALLAGLLQSPDSDNPVNGDRSAAMDRRSYVLSAMAKMKVITADQAAQAQAQPLTLHPTTQPNDCQAVASDHNDWGFFCDYFRQWWNAQPAFGATVQDRENALNEGGYRIVTSLDAKVQAAALRQSLTVYGYNSARALPIAVVQPGTGRVLALAVNRHYSLTPNAHGRNYPNTVNQLIAGGGGVNGYPSGSTFKMFTMLAALTDGKPLDTSTVATSPLVTQYPDNGSGNCGGYWCPVNDSPSWMDGYRTMWNGFGRSVNTYFVWLEEQIGADKAVAMAQRLGITFRAASDARLAANGAAGWGSFTLGVADTTPLDLANAYATVAAEGMYCKPDPVVSISDASGNAIAAANPSCDRVLDQDVARAATDAARCPVGQDSAFGKCDGGTGTVAAGILGGRPLAGKTGSSEYNQTETFVGFTPQIAAAGIAADPDNTLDRVGTGVEDRVVAAVAHTIAAAVSGMPYQDFTAPSTAMAFGY